MTAARKLVEFAEITGMEGNVISTQTIFGYEQVDVDADGKVVGNFYATGVMPEFMTRLERYGFKIPASYFLASGVTSRAESELDR